MCIRDREEAERAGFTEDTLQRGGYSVVTTIDSAAQRSAEEAVAEVTARAPGSHAALVAIEPGTGEVRAYHSGTAAPGGYDWAAAPQYPGTAFEPFVPFLRPPPPRVAQAAPCERECTDAQEGVEQTAARLGFDTGAWRSGPDFFERLEAGEQPVSAVDVAHAYATIAAQGQERKPRMLDEIRDKEGRVVLSAESAPRPAFAADAADSAARASEIAGARWPGSADRRGSAPQVVERGWYHSMTAWTNGFNPSLSTSVVLSAADEQNRQRPLVGTDGRPLDLSLIHI